MSKSDQWVNVILAGMILIHLAVWIAGFVSHKLFWLITLLNLFAGLSVILYWLNKQLNIQQHHLEGRELVVLALEMIVVICSIYLFVSHNWSNRLRVLQYVYFGVHLSALVLLMIFMLTFKMKRLI